MNECKVSECPHPVWIKKRLLCRLHYNRWYKTGRLDDIYIPAKRGNPDKPQPEAKPVFEKAMFCSEVDCYNEPYGRKNVCKTHHNRQWEAKNAILGCSYEGCLADRYLKTLCEEHYAESEARLCEIESCNSNVRIGRRGKYCRKHQGRLDKYGDAFEHVADARGKSFAAADYSSVDEMFDALVEVGEQDDCWFWTGNKNVKGYGNICFNSNAEGTHRFAYRRAYGDIPEGFVIDHLCMKPSCCNPEHLEAVTSEENIRRAQRYYSRFNRCLVEGCDDSGRYRAMCKTHYMRANPNPPAHRGADIFTRLEAKYRKMPDGCWDWIGIFDTHKYGVPVFSHKDSSKVIAYRLMYELYTEDYLTPEWAIDHLCGNCVCVNPDHLEKVSFSENSNRRWVSARTHAQSNGKEWHAA